MPLLLYAWKFSNHTRKVKRLLMCLSFYSDSNFNFSKLDFQPHKEKIWTSDIFQKVSLYTLYKLHMMKTNVGHVILNVLFDIANATFSYERWNHASLRHNPAFETYILQTPNFTAIALHPRLVIPHTPQSQINNTQRSHTHMIRKHCRIVWGPHVPTSP